MRKKKADNPTLLPILTQGLESQFWQTLKKAIEDDKITKLEDTILNDEYVSDEQGNKHLLSEEVRISRRELARIERNNWQELLNYPERKIAILTQKSFELDPDKDE